jgi:hypothetical protein
MSVQSAQIINSSNRYSQIEWDGARVHIGAFEVTLMGKHRYRCQCNLLLNDKWRSVVVYFDSEDTELSEKGVDEIISRYVMPEIDQREAEAAASICW